MDDEKYFGLTGYQMSGNTHYYTSDKDRTPMKLKTGQNRNLNQKPCCGLQFQKRGFLSLQL